MSFAEAWVRPVPDRFAECLREAPVPIDVERARAQHEGYVRALQDLGVRVTALPALHDAPDSVFVEDTAVVLPSRILVTRPGAPSRRPEADALLEGLAPDVPRQVLSAPATLDGGDVLPIGRFLFVGRSTRSNAEGHAALQRVAANDGLTVVSVDMQAGLHLQSVATALDPETIVYFGQGFDRGAFEAHGFACLEVPEYPGANLLSLPGGLLVSAAAPRTAELLSAKRSLCAVDVSEMHKGDGALTCLSLRFSAGWPLSA